jgi:autotransporter-associated beta strand protein
LITNINFDTNAGNFTIGSTTGGQLQLQSGGSINILTTLYSTNAQETINAPVVIEGANASDLFTNNSSTGTGAGSGTLTIAGAVSGGTAGTSTAILTGNNNNANTISGVISNGTATAMAVFKNGQGTWDLTAANTYTGLTTVASGTLELNFAASGAPATNIIKSGNLLSLGGGTLFVNGSTAGGNTETFGTTTTGTTITAGQSTISIATSGGTAPVVNLGAITVSNTTGGFGTLEISSTGTVTTETAGGGSLGVLGTAQGTSSTDGYATYGLSDWATTDTTGGVAGTSGGAPLTIIGLGSVTGGYVTTLSGGTGGNGGNLNVTSNLVVGANNAQNTVRFNTAAALTVNVNNKWFIPAGVLVTPNVMANNVSISNGNWFANYSSNTAQNEYVWQNNTLGFFVNSGGLINGRGNSNAPLTYIQSGPGTVQVTGANSYTGADYLNGGATLISNDQGLGAVATAATVYLNGGSVVASATISLDNAPGSDPRPINIGNAGGGLAVTGGNTLTVDGVVTAAAGSGPLIIGIPAQAANNNILGEVIGTGTGTGGAATANTQLLANGTVTLTNTGNSTSFPAGIIIDSGTLLYNGTQATLGSAGTTPISANGGTLALGASHNLTAGAIAIANGGAITGTGTSSLSATSYVSNGGSASAILGGSGGFANLSNTTTLSGLNTYTGNTSVVGGTLIVATGGSLGASSASTTVSGGTLQLGTTGGNVSVAVSGFTFNSGGLNFSLNGTNDTSSLLTVSGTLAINTAITNQLGLTPFGTLTNLEQFTILTATGGITGSNLTNLSSINPVVDGRYTLTPTVSGNSLVINVSGGAANLVWAGGLTLPAGTNAGADGTTWNNTQTAAAKNWDNTGSSDAYDYFYNLDNVTFTDPSGPGAGVPGQTGGTLNYTVNLTTTNSPGSVTVNTANTYTFTGGGSIAGNGELTVVAGQLNLNNTVANTYAGGTDVQAAGILVTGSVGAISSTGQVTVDGTLDLNGNNQTIATLADSNTMPTGNGTGVIESSNGNATLTVTSGGTFSGTLLNSFSPTTNTLALTVSGGTLVLTGGNGYSGLTSISGGATLQIGNGSNTSSTPGSGSITDSGTFAIDMPAATSLTIGNTIGGGGGLLQEGSGTTDLTGTNTFNGITQVTGGTLIADNATGTQSLALQDSTVNLNGGTVSFGTTTTTATFAGLTGNSSQSFNLTNTNATPAAVTLTVNNAGTNVYNGTIGGLGGLTMNGAGSLTIGTANYSGATNVSNGTLTLNGGSTGTQASSADTLTGILNVTAGTIAANTVFLGTNGNLSLTGSSNATFNTITDGGNTENLNANATSGAITINTSGTIALGNTYIGRSGGLTITAGTVTSTLLDESSNASAPAHTSNFSMSGGTYTVGSSASTGAFVTGVTNNGNNNFTQTGGSVTYSGTDGAQFGYNAFVNISGATTLDTFSGITLNPLSEATPSELTISGGTTYLGGTTSGVGLTINLPSATVFATFGATTGTATIGATSSWTSAAPITLAAASSTTFQAANASSGAENITLNDTTASTPQLTGSGSVTVSGAGVVAFSDPFGNTYSGTTTVSSGGTLLVNNTSNSATGSGSVTVSAGGTLAGAGSINASGGTSTVTIGAVTPSTKATVLVGLQSTTDVSTITSLGLSSTGTTTIQNANLVYNLDANTPGAGSPTAVGASTQLNVAATNVVFNSNAVTLTLDLQNNATVNGFSFYTLIAGTGNTTPNGATASTGQYAGLTISTTATAPGLYQILNSGIGGTGNLTLAFGGANAAGDTALYGNSQLFLYNNGSGVDDIDVEVIPEPSTWAMMIGGLALLVFWQRRRRQN